MKINHFVLTLGRADTSDDAARTDAKLKAPTFAVTEIYK
jgi:hypothetical protein